MVLTRRRRGQLAPVQRAENAAVADRQPVLMGAQPLAGVSLDRQCARGHLKSHGAGHAEHRLRLRDRFQRPRRAGLNLADDRVDDAARLAESQDVSRLLEHAADLLRRAEQLVAQPHIGVGGGHDPVDARDQRPLAAHAKHPLELAGGARPEMRLQCDERLAVAAALLRELADRVQQRLHHVHQVLLAGFVVHRELDLVQPVLTGQAVREPSPDDVGEPPRERDDAEGEAGRR